MTSTIDVRPIETWPGTLRSNQQRTYTKFNSSWPDTKKALIYEADHLSGGRGTGIVIQVAIPPEDFRLDGNLRAKHRFDHPGVVVALSNTKHGPLSFAADSYKDAQWSGYLPGWQSNVRAVALTLASLRDIARYGVGTGSESYTGWAQLPPAPGDEAPVEWTTESAARHLMEKSGVTVGWTQAASGDRGVITAMYRSAMRRMHPDVGGSADSMELARLKSARDYLLPNTNTEE